MKKGIGVALILAAYGILTIGGAFFGPAALYLGRSAVDPRTFPVCALGLVLGIIGGGLLWAGVILIRAGDEGWPLSQLKTALFGMFFPGAAQAYARRWLWSALFLFFPWGVLHVGLILSIVTGMVAQFLPGIAAPMMGLNKALMAVFMPSKWLYALLWLASIAEGYLWAGRHLSDPVPRRVQWQIPVIGLGILAYFFTFFLLINAVAVGYYLRLGLVVKKSAASLAGKELPLEAQGITKDPIKAKEHDTKAMGLVKTDLKAATEEWAEAVKLDPEEPRYRYNLGTAYMMLGEKEKGTGQYEQYLKLRPNAPEAEKLRKAMGKGTG